MARILAYGSPALGHLLPMARLLGELAGRGHDVHLRTLPAGIVEANRHGIDTRAAGPRIEAIQSRGWVDRNMFDALNLATHRVNPEIDRDLLDRHAVLTVTGDPCDIVADLSGIWTWHSSILPAHPSRAS